ncbi:MAG: HAMP domain-containing histidine kinase [Ideonella sp.]|nr:HAMP domain-containing histidine kinase [Ideonella sp.]
MSPDPAAPRARWHAAHARWQATRRRWRHSLKWRLVTLFLLLALAMTGVFLLGMQRVLSGGWTSYARPIAADYIDRLAAEIGSPPDAARAQALVARLPISVRIEGPLLNYDSHPGDRARRHWGGDGDDDDDGHGPARLNFVRATADGHRITFGLAAPVQSTRPRFIGWLTLAVLLLLTIAAYAVVRRLLRPIESIDAGVTRFGAGDFAQPIVTPRRDELGDLAERINTMARSLQGMLDAKRALLLAISHELRSPLTRARVNAELVPEGAPRDALLRDLAAMRDLIADLLESERLASGHAALQTETVHLPALVRALVDTQFAGVPLTLQLDDTMPPVQADPMRLKLLLRNLIDNALRHAAGAPRPPEVTLARAAGGQVLLRVRDHGPGVCDEQLAQLAQPLYRSDAARQRATGGAGLGLYLCLLIVKAHGGRLTFEHAEPGLAVSARWPAG